MTQPTPYSTYCRFLEVTKELDMRSLEAIDASKKAITGPKDTFFWCSPCIGGSQRQIYNINKAYEDGNLATLYKIRGHRQLHERLKPAFFEVAKHAIDVGARVILEWPGGCLYWDDVDYAAFFKKYGFRFVEFDGCMYGLKAVYGKGKGLHIRKPWKIACVNTCLP